MMLVGPGATRSTVLRAQASAAEALSHQCGGTPQPHAQRSPASAIAAIPKPQVANLFRLGFNIDPSMYQVTSGGMSCSGLRPQWKVSVALTGSAGSLIVRSPVVHSSLSLSLPIVFSAS